MKLLSFLGSFRVLALYLPIALILVAALAQLLARRPRYARIAGAMPFLWGVTAASVVLTAMLQFAGDLTFGSTPARASPRPADAATLAALRSAGFQARQIAADRSMIRVSLASGDPVDDRQVEALVDAADAIEVLDLRRVSVTDRRLAELAKLANLVRLDLSDNDLDDGGVASLAAFRKLEYLNLVGNAGVTDAALQSLAALSSLKKVYLWNTAVTPEAAGAQRGGPAFDVGVALPVELGQPADVTGAWDVDYLDRTKRPAKAVMTLKQNGESVTGALGTSSVIGSVRGTRVFLYVVTAGAFGKVGMDLEGDVAGGRIEGGPRFTAVHAEPR